MGRPCWGVCRGLRSVGSALGSAQGDGEAQVEVPGSRGRCVMPGGQVWDPCLKALRTDLPALGLEAACHVSWAGSDTSSTGFFKQKGAACPTTATLGTHARWSKAPGELGAASSLTAHLPRQEVLGLLGKAGVFSTM